MSPGREVKSGVVGFFLFVLFLFSTGVNLFKLREDERETVKKIERKKKKNVGKKKRGRQEKIAKDGE